MCVANSLDCSKARHVPRKETRRTWPDGHAPRNCQRAYHFAPGDAEKSRRVYSPARALAEIIRQAYPAVLADAEKSLRAHQCSAPWAEKLGALYHHRCQALAPLVQREDFLGPHTAFLAHSTVFLGTGKGGPARPAESLGAPTSRLVQQTVFLGASRGKVVHPTVFLGASRGKVVHPTVFLGAPPRRTRYSRRLFSALVHSPAQKFFSPRPRTPGRTKRPPGLSAAFASRRARSQARQQRSWQSQLRFSASQARYRR